MDDRYRLMQQRQAAVEAKDWARFQALTSQLAALPMRGVPPLTQRDIDRYARGKQTRGAE